MGAATAISNLLYRYAEAFDDGDFEAAARLFDRGRLVMGGRVVEGAEAIVATWQAWVHLYDGSPRTRHLITNPIIEIALDGESATCRSQWTVLQATSDLPLQVVATGRYLDRFARHDAEWHFAERNYAQVDLTGNTGAHMRQTLAS